MKPSFALIAVLSVFGIYQAHSVPVSSRGLPQDLEDFLALIPVEQVKSLILEYLSHDDDFGKAVDYVLSDDFKSLVVSIEAMPEIKSLFTYLQQGGINIYEYINKLHELLKLDRINTFGLHKISGGLPGFIKDVEALLPLKEIQELYEKKLQTSEEFAALIEKLKSPEFQGLIDRIIHNPEFQTLIHKAESKGVDVQAIFDLLSTFLGFKLPHHQMLYLARNLKDDLNDFLKLMPIEEIKDVYYEYVSNDEDFGEAMDYILSDEFKQLIIEIENMSEVRDLLQFLEESGLAAYKFIENINRLLGINKISPTSNGKVRKITGGLPGFIEDIIALLPVDEIEALYKKKLETSEDFVKLVARLMSNQFQGLINRLMANPRLQDLMKRAETKGVNVQAILDFITTLLGLKFPERPRLFFYSTRNLNDDLNDLLALVPVDKIQDVFYEYMENDGDFGEALDYVLSEEFKTLLVEVEGLPEVKSLLEFLVASGLDAYNFVNQINDYLEIDHISATYRISRKKITGGLSGFIEDIKALLPMDKIEELYNQKLQTSENFKSLIQRLKSREFQGLVNKLLANPNMQNLIKKAEAKDVDVQAIFDFFTILLGLHFPERPRLFFYSTRNLKDDLNDLLALVPVDKIQDVFYEYMENDGDFGEALDYVLSEEFKTLLVEVEGLPEVKSLLEFLVASGLDAYNFVNQINDYLEIDHISATYRISRKKITGGLSGFIEDVKALLPLDKIEELYNQKLQTSENFKSLIQRLKSREFQGLVNKLLANPNMQNLIKKAEEKDVDVQAIFDFFTILLGLHFPERPRLFFYSTRNLNDDLNDLLALVPVDKIRDVFYEYTENDGDFGEALDYVLSEEFKTLLVEVEGLPEVKSLLEFLEASGLDAYNFVNQINDYLKIDHISATYRISRIKITGGLSGFIEDVKALLPLDKIEELYNQKLQTSENFKSLIQRLKSREFQGLVNKLLANSNMQNLIKRAKAKNVDVQAIFDFFTTLLGLKFPEFRKCFMRPLYILNH